MKHFVLAVLLAAGPASADPVVEQSAAPDAALQVVSSPKPEDAAGAAAPESGAATESSIRAPLPPTAFLAVGIAGAPSGRFELRPYPSGREQALHYLRGEETKPTLTIETKAAKATGLELPLGFWKLTFRADRGGGACDLPLTPFKTGRDAGALPGPAGTRRTQVVDEAGKAVAGVLVGQMAFGHAGRPWQPSFFRAESSREGWVEPPQAFRFILWALAPGYEPYAGHFYENDPPRRIVLVKQAWRKVRLIDQFQRPIVGALLKSRSGVPLGFTDEQGELEGPFADRATVLIEDAAGRAFRERIVRQRSTGELRLQAGRPVPLRGEVVARGSGDTLEGAWVWLAERPETWRVAEKRGQFEIYDFWNEPTSIEADAPGYSSAKALAGPDQPATLRLAPVDRVLFGSVLTLTGEPLVGARIAVSSKGRRATWTATTDEQGQYRLTGLPYQELWAEASHPVAFPFTKNFSRTFPEVRLDFELETGSRVFGRVSAENGGMLAQVRVLKASADQRDPELLGITNFEGEYSIGPVPAGKHTLIFELRDFAREELEVIVAKNEPESDAGQIQLREELLWDGRVVDENQQPLEGVRIFAWKKRQEFEIEWPPWRSADAVTDTEGRFVLSGLAKDQVTDLEMRAPERPPQLFDNVGVNESSSGKDWAIALGARLEIEVVDPRRDPVFAAEVTLIRHEGDFMRNWQLSDEDGKVIYTALAAGSLVVEVKAENFGIFRSEEIELFPGQQRKLVAPLGEGITLEGRVFKANGEPARGYWVSLVDPNQSPSRIRARVDTEGYYRLEGLPRGNREIEIAGNHFFEVYKQPMELDVPFESLDVTLPKPSSSRLVVLVVDERGLAMSGVEVRVYRSDGTGLRQETDHEGMVLLSELPADDFTIEALAPDASWKAAKTSAKLESSTSGVVLVLEKVREAEPGEAGSEGSEP